MELQSHLYNCLLATSSRISKRQLRSTLTRTTFLILTLLFDPSPHNPKHLQYFRSKGLLASQLHRPETHYSCGCSSFTSHIQSNTKACWLDIPNSSQIQSFLKFTFISTLVRLPAFLVERPPRASKVCISTHCKISDQMEARDVYKIQVQQHGWMLRISYWAKCQMQKSRPYDLISVICGI